MNLAIRCKIENLMIKGNDATMALVRTLGKKRYNFVEDNERKPTCIPNRIICCLLSDEAAAQVAGIQTWLEQVFPKIKGRVDKGKMHLTLLALSSTDEFKNEASTLLQETANLSFKIYGIQVRVFRGHLVITLKFAKAS